MRTARSLEAFESQVADGLGAARLEGVALVQVLRRFSGGGSSSGGEPDGGDSESKEGGGKSDSSCPGGGPVRAGRRRAETMFSTENGLERSTLSSDSVSGSVSHASGSLSASVDQSRSDKSASSGSSSSEGSSRARHASGSPPGSCARLPSCCWSGLRAADSSGPVVTPKSVCRQESVRCCKPARKGVHERLTRQLDLLRILL